MRRKMREPKPMLPALASCDGPALIKFLASCNSGVRSQSLRLVQSWLVSQSQQLSASDVRKLWKGLFYCMWHADKIANQVALIDRLTTLFLSLQPSVALEFFRGFLLTLRREWPGIDRLRLDKFYLLIRRFVRTLFELLRLRKWDCEVLVEYMGILENDGFLAEDKLHGNGVNYQVVSVFLEELKGVGFPVRKEIVDEILRPFFVVMMRAKDRALLGKVKSCIFEDLLKAGRGLLERQKAGFHSDEEDKDLLLGVVALKMGLPNKLYEVGSSVECVQGNRKVVLGLNEEYLKLEKEYELSGVEIPIPNIDCVCASGDGGGGGGDDEVPQLIPFDYTTGNCNCELGEPERSEDANKDEDDAVARGLEKCRKTEKGIHRTDKKSKNKKKRRKDDSGTSKIQSAVEETGKLAVANDMDDTACENSLIGNGTSDWAEIDIDESVIANLRREFEKIAAEAGCNNDEDTCLSNNPQKTMHRRKEAKKRKRTKGFEDQKPDHSSGPGADSAAKSADKSAKKVRFAMKNNLVWKPQNPLPPESLRLPPSVTPRGSALKKGVPPGPMIELRPAKKKTKPKKKAQKNMMSVTPRVKRRKILTSSA